MTAGAITDLEKLACDVILNDPHTVTTACVDALTIISKTMKMNHFDPKDA